MFLTWACQVLDSWGYSTLLWDCSSGLPSPFAWCRRFPSAPAPFCVPCGQWPGQPRAVPSPRAMHVSTCSSLSWITSGWCSVTQISELCFQMQHDHDLSINLSTQFCADSVSCKLFKYTWFHTGALSGALSRNAGHICGTKAASTLYGSSGLQLHLRLW